jgi:hypothetical protein
MKLKRKLILKALTDPEFRKMLQENPEQALSADELKEITGGNILNTAALIDLISQNTSPMIFCVVQPQDPNGPWYA